MTYIALLYSPRLDQFETNCGYSIRTSRDVAKWVQGLSNYFNHRYNVDDFYIVSITKIGE